MQSMKVCEPWWIHFGEAKWRSVPSRGNFLDVGKSYFKTKPLNTMMPKEPYQGTEYRCSSYRHQMLRKQNKTNKIPFIAESHPLNHFRKNLQKPHHFSGERISLFTIKVQRPFDFELNSSPWGLSIHWWLQQQPRNWLISYHNALPRSPHFLFPNSLVIFIRLWAHSKLDNSCLINQFLGVGRGGGNEKHFDTFL